MKTSFRIALSEVLLVSMLFSTYVAPTYALWDENITGLSVPPPAPAEYISCPTDHGVTDVELAGIIGITVDELVEMKRARSLTNTTICQLPKARIARALKKTKDPSQPSIDGFMAWRNESLISGTGGVINTENASSANIERQALVVNDGPLVNIGSVPMPQGSGVIDKTRWFPLGPNNVSGRIITMLIDPDYPDTLWAGSAGGGLWKSTNNGHNWSPVADFPGNTAISVIKMDPHDHNIMYIGTGDRDLNGIPGNGIFKSVDRGTTWIQVSSTSISKNALWKKVTDIYIDPIQIGRFIVTGGYHSGSLQSDDNMQTWNPTVAGLPDPFYGQWVKENPYISGSLIINIDYKVFMSGDYGHTFTGTTSSRPDYITEIAFGKPNTITVSGAILSAINKKIRLQNNANDADAHVDALAINVINANPTVSGELCIRPVGSTNTCSSYSGQLIDSTGGLFLFSGSSLDSPDISHNGGYIEFELFFDSNLSILPGDISLEIDHIDYATNSQPQVDRYIQGQSFGSGIIYASSEENKGTLYRSGDLGLTWEFVSNPSIDGATLLGNQGSYANTIWVNPFDNQHIIIGGLDLFESRDGGYTWRKISDWSNGHPARNSGGGSVHADQHIIMNDPRFDNTNNRRIYFGNDGGIYRVNDIDAVVNPYIGWEFAGNGLNITQFYSIAGTGNIIGGGAQDNATTVYNGVNSGNWNEWLASGDGMDSTIDPHGRFIYGESYFGGAFARGKVENNIVIPEIIQYLSGGTSFENDGAGWVMPMLLDPNNPSHMFAGARSLWYSENVDTEISSDVIFRNIGNPDPTNSVPIDLISISKQDSNRIWVSKWYKLFRSMSGVTLSGEIQDWKEMTESNLPQNQKITHIEIDYYNPNKVYVTYGGYEGSNIWMTENNGVSWVDISANLPKTPVYTIKQFRNNPNYLYVGTEAGLFSSENGGQTWTTTNEGPANTPVFDIEWYNDNTLLIATFGRGAWALDLNNLTIVPPPVATVSGETLTSLSGSQNITHYKNPIDITAGGNGTLFYTIDDSVPNGTGSSIMPGEVLSLSGGNIIFSGTTIASGSLNTIKFRSRDFAGNWSDVSTYVFKYKSTSYVNTLVTTTNEPYRATITFNTTINLSGSIFYGTSSGNLTSGSGTEMQFSGDINETFTLTGLTANTKYYYQIQAGGTGSLSESHSGSFTTLNTSIPIDTPLVTQSSSGTLYSTGKVYIVGSTSTGVTNIVTQSGMLELSDTGSTFIAKIPLTGLSISSSGAWDGTIDSPIKVQTATGIRFMSGTVAVDSIYSIGNNMASLALSGQLATITLIVNTPDGSTADIYRSPNPSTPYNKIMTCTITHNTCTFTTNHFSLFAVGNIKTPIIASVVASGGGGGGGGGTHSNNNSQGQNTTIILTPLQIQYQKNTTTTIITEDTIKKGKSTIPESYTGTQNKADNYYQIYNLISNFETKGYDRTKMIIGYNQISKLLRKKLRAVGSIEKENILIILQKITKSRNALLNKSGK